MGFGCRVGVHWLFCFPLRTGLLTQLRTSLGLQVGYKHPWPFMLGGCCPKISPSMFLSDGFTTKARAIEVVQDLCLGFLEGFGFPGQNTLYQTPLQRKAVCRGTLLVFHVRLGEGMMPLPPYILDPKPP